jgi:hypothetical protein
MNEGESMSTGQECSRRLGGRPQHNFVQSNPLCSQRSIARSPAPVVLRRSTGAQAANTVQTVDGARIIRGAALGIMFLALLLAAVSVHAAPLPVPVPAGAALTQPTGPMLFLRGQDGRLATLLPEEAKVTARVNALWAHVTVQHRFRSAAMGARSALYVLPLPADARPRRLELAVGDRRMEISLAAAEADAHPEMLALPVSRIPANSEVLVRLAYDCPVELGEGRFVLALPLSRLGGGKPAVSNAAWQRMDTTLSVDLDPGLPIAELYSPSHGIDISREQDERRRIVLADSETANGRDFILVWKPADPHASIGALRRYTALKMPALPLADDALVLRTRMVGTLPALVPATVQPALLVGSPIDNGAILDQLAARTGAAPSMLGSPLTPGIVGAALLIWALGAFYLATRRGAGGASTNDSTRETTT